MADDELHRIPGYEGIYSITRDGRVWAHERRERRRAYKAQWLKPWQMGRYLGVALWQDDGGRHFYIHHLVMAAWGLPQPSPKHEINHRDFDRYNNHIDNLEWVTRTANIRHAVANGSAMVAGLTGSANHAARLTEAQVLEIRARYTGKRGQQTALAREYGVDINAIHNIVRRKTWTHI